MSKECFSPYTEVEARIEMISRLERLESEGKEVSKTKQRVEEGLFNAVEERIDQD